jgi:thiol-disulfide isomerase/thioredoxin
MKILLALLLTFNIFATDFKPYSGNTPNLELVDIDGKTHNIEDYKGSVVLVQFWATYCPPCIKEMPSMNELQDKLKAEHIPFKILAVNMAEQKERIVNFVDKVKPEFTILLDASGTSIGKWGVFAAPSNFIVAPNGKIVFTLFGGIEWDSPEVITKIKHIYQNK